jgi:serine/threonine protein kinase
MENNILPCGATLRQRYEIQRLFHSGGMGDIYLAADKTLFNRLCVVKQVRERILSEAHRKKLEEEALRMSRLSHPGIAMILDHFVEDDYYYLVVEYIQGKTLSEIYKEHQSKLTEIEVVAWASSICDVISYIHGEGILHRDISPDNIMVTREGAIKFIDFGTLRELRYIAAGKTAGMGKYGYTPPEQWQGKPVAQSDIFALGATLYHLLTGYLPLSKSYVTGHAPQREDFYPQFPPIRSWNPLVSAGLEAVLRKALRLEIEERYSSALEMREALLVLTPGAAKSVSSFSTEKTRTGKNIRPKLETLSEDEIKRKTITDAVQHPVVLLPLAVCILSGAYFTLLSPVFGGRLGSFSTAVIAGVTTAISFFYHFRGEQSRTEQEIQAIRVNEKTEAEAVELKTMVEKLQDGFSGMASAEGARSLAGLVSEFEQLQGALGEDRAGDSISMSLVPGLAEEIYRRGLSVLTNALELLNAVQYPGKETLEAEIAQLEADFAVPESDPNRSERLKLKEELLAFRKERLGKINRLQLSADQLLHQSRRCEDSLYDARIEIAAIRAGNTGTSVNPVIEALQQRINQVKEVEAELKKMGY